MSLSNIIKSVQMADRVLEYGFTREFEDIRVKESENPETECGQEESADQEYDRYLQTAELYEDAIRKTQVILDQARTDAEDLLNQARTDGEKLRVQAMEEGRQAGYDAGYEDGFRKAYEAHKEVLDAREEEFLEAMKNAIESVTEEKEKLLDKYIDDLKKVTLTIAEKVIQTSLRSSGEIIKRMIVAAAGKLKKTQWMKIYVSQRDAGMMIQGDVGLLSELSHISGNIKIIAMDHEEDGACIIELPEEIIDVSVNTQLENIKGILNNARL
ncbi:flagellar biosynthesis/type III secretory pathway protein [Lacrimispora sphenoides]|uniref:Flagellar assembly protein FliH n=1 Tax=Lacrimispora sphenoides JCM 1415 TaxID=1297793 RepID=A0ABY1CD58_9FIRM|nr:flagellar assembly protein FliH [[Clostridium] sphenoides JCM 1415]SUY52526.1 flagellar biosynthesis/type III secretory pathway protein [Lacrimispora sphenoides]